MTLNKVPNTDDLIESSGSLGWGVVFANNNIPSYMSPDSGGNGSITAAGPNNMLGVRVDSGADSGSNDYARVFKPSRFPGGKRVVDKAVTFVSFELSTATPWTDNGHIGECSNSPGDDSKGAFIDFTRETVTVGQSGTQIDTSITLTSNSRPAYLLKITSNFANDETTFRIVGDDGNTNITETIGQTIGSMPALTTVQENGGGGSYVDIRHAQSVVLMSGL